MAQARAGGLHDVSGLPGFVALIEDRPVGFTTYAVAGTSAELAVIDAGKVGLGMGTALLEAVAEAARTAGAAELWAVTSNDNLDALRFYQRRGFRLRGLRAGAIDRARRDLKAQIPELGSFGIAIRDEIELVRALEG